MTVHDDVARGQGWRQSRLFVLAIGLLLTPFRAASQPSGAEQTRMLVELQRSYQKMVPEIRKTMFASLPPSQRDVERSITYTISLDDDIDRAWADVSDGNRLIDISVGFVRSLEMLCDMVYIEVARNRPGLFHEYLEYTIDARRKNVARQREGKPVLFVKSPYTYVGMNDAAIDRFTADPKRLAFVGALFSSAFGFTLAHEVGHHMLGHVPAPMGWNPEQARECETAADSWAAERHMEVGYLPIGAIVMFERFRASDPEAVVMEAGRSHPADARRLKALYATMLANLDRFRTKFASQGQSVEAFRAQIREQLAVVDKELASQPAKR